jgi:hypothetical protein
MTAKTGIPADGASAGPVPRQSFRVLQETRDAVLAGSPAGVRPRSLVAESWERSLAAHVDPDGDRPPQVYALDVVPDVRAAHPLQTVVPVLRKMLVDIADVSQHIMIVTDAQGTILWREGASGICLEADPVGLCEGTGWAEEAIGTNAMGTALAVDAPVQIDSAEHLVRTYHGWTCAAAPVHDPDSGQLIGAIDVSGYRQSLHPALVSLVSATAELAESHLRMRMAMADERLRVKYMPHLHGLRGQGGALLTATGRVLAAELDGSCPDRFRVGAGIEAVRLDDGREATLEPLSEGYLLRVLPRSRSTASQPRPALSLSFLRELPAAVLDGRELPLSLRRAELLALLTLHPTGLTAEQLALQLYGESGNPVTARAEIHRLRAQLGDTAMQTKPYRLRADIDADFLTARAALRDGHLDTALNLAQAPLLARSEAPAIRTERDELGTGLRRAVLKRGNAEALWAYCQRDPGRYDIEAFERLTAGLPPRDPRKAITASRLAVLLRDDA